jgi:hypothetical protein
MRPNRHGDASAAFSPKLRISPSGVGTISSISSCWDAGFSWVVNHLESFLPADLNSPDQLKGITELSLFYAHVGLWVPAAEKAKLAPLGAFLHSFLATNTQLANQLRRLPSQCNPYLLTYLPLRIAGFRIPGFEEAIGVLNRAGYPEALETMPYRELELQYVAWKAGLRKTPASWGSAYRATVLGRTGSPVYFTLFDVYSVTHTLIYLTGFCGPATVPTGESRRAIAVVEALLVHYWRKPDWDVTAELLINLLALDRYDTQLFEGAVGAIMHAWREDGALPGPHFRKESEADPEHLFRNCYHTTLVGLILCAGYLYRVRLRSDCFVSA